ncbi:hypothetical protein SMACR_04121 [Sordaria macrospora]|uniref:Protein kinase domain-containing protein n=1 Tax=Sordaria macrospora TaxID=5147 RepID=A0A8S8ZJT8_SORMA|nr:hypothetical protein SMACR_04121 [Sordaria macrospora]WPJ64414.1 hypothetical protein SMAC4_04121 [Sordaria macrospora]
MAPRAKAVGLADPHVDICFDRGNCYYDTDHPFKRRNTDIKPHDDGLEIFRTVRRELEARIIKKGSNYFIPRGCLHDIFTPGRLLAVVQQLWKNMSGHDQQSFCQKVLYDVRCWKVFLLFILTKHHKLLPQLWKEESDRNEKLRLSDRCLPLKSIDSESGEIKCQNENHSFHQFPGWEEEDLSHCQLHSFEQASYALNAVYFKLPTDGEQNHVHYCLGPKDVLPYTIMPSRAPDSPSSDRGFLSERADSPGQSSNNGNPRSDTDQDDNLHGGFGEVMRIIIDRSHFDFGHLGSDNGNNKEVAFALKRLHASDKEAFDKELASLISVKAQKGTHLIKLLTTFSVIEQDGGNEVFYLLFPWAEGNLWKYWKVHQPRNEQERLALAPWMAQQCHQLAIALLCVHNERQLTLSYYDILDEKGELYGRHGDIKAENVLYFEADRTLVLSDFGLGRLHTKYSRSNADPKALERSATYRAPEFDLPRGRISRACDVFSLGCTFLEFVTWHVLDYDAVYNVFPNKRMDDDTVYGFETDTFFKIEGDIAIIKPQVRDWMEDLKKDKEDKKASEYTKQFLDIIEQMLNPDPTARIKVSKLVRELGKISRACEDDKSYYGDQLL